MERSKKIKWKKIGRGSFRFGNKIIKPGQEFFASEDDIPDAFRDVIIPLEGKEESKEVDFREAKKGEDDVGVSNKGKSKFETKHRTGAWYDVINSVTGKRVNEKALSKENAEKLVKSLE